MSERKVLNKYYPPDFDPRKLPRLKLSRDRQFVIRIMAPMSIKCSNCGEYIYKGKKFNARQETVQNENYLGLRIYRFYIKCPRCMSEITFKTDPKNADYVMEHGGKRCFDAAKLAARIKEKELEKLDEEQQTNPMLALEKRTEDSKMEMESLEKLEELKELNKRHADIDFDQLLNIHTNKLDDEQINLELEEKHDEQLTRDVFKNKIISTKDIGEKFDFSNVFRNSMKPTKKDCVKSDITNPIVIIRKRPIDDKIHTASMDVITSHDTQQKNIKNRSDDIEVKEKFTGLVSYGNSSNTDSDN